MANLMVWKIRLTGLSLSDEEFLEIEKYIDKFSTSLEEFIEERFDNAFREDHKQKFELKMETVY